MSQGNLQEILRKSCSIEVEALLVTVKANLSAIWSIELNGFPLSITEKLTSSLNQALEEERESLIQARMEALGKKIIDEIRSPRGEVRDIVPFDETKKGWFK